MACSNQLLLASLVVFGTISCAERPELFVSHFDPPTGTLITDLQPSVTIIDLDDEPLVCFTLDGSRSPGTVANAPTG